MCDFNKEFKLCTCDKQEIQHRKNTHKYKKENQDKEVFVWTLYAYKGKINKEKYVSVVGMISFPIDKLGSQELTAEYVIHQLNHKNCFDFEYSPTESDYLVIEVETIRWNDYIMPFIYRENKWTFDSYDSFTTITEKIKNGKLVFIDKDENLST